MQEYDGAEFLEHVALATSIDQEWEAQKSIDDACCKGLEFDCFFARLGRGLFHKNH